jgi:integrase
VPAYKTNIERIIVESEFKQMYELCQNDNEKRLLLCLWLSGARPGELMAVKGSDCAFDHDGTKEIQTLRIRVPTEKLHDTGDFQIRERVLEWNRGDVWVEKLIPLLPSAPQEFLLWPSDTRPSMATLSKRAERCINQLSEQVMGVALSPYHFRHGLLTNMAETKDESGSYTYNLFDLKAWKGAKTTQSVEGYIHGRTPRMNMGAINRTRNLE